MRTKVKGSTWCSACNKIQPSILTNLVRYDTFQEVRGTCVVCNHSVSKKIERSKRQVMAIAPTPKPLPYSPQETTSSLFKKTLIRFFTFLGATYVIYQAFGYVLEAAL